MAIQRMDNVAVVVDDLDSAVAFFTELGMELEGRAPIEGLFADRTVGLDGVRSEIAMMRTPDGHGRVELTEYHAPAASWPEPHNPPPNPLAATMTAVVVVPYRDDHTKPNTGGKTNTRIAAQLR